MALVNAPLVTLPVGGLAVDEDVGTTLHVGTWRSVTVAGAFVT